jgi:hypothetical protein
MGLSLPLNKFSILFPQEGMVRITIDTDLDDDENRWSFWLYRLTRSRLF